MQSSCRTFQANITYHISSQKNSNQGYRVSTGKQQRAAVSQKAVKTKQLSLRLAGEWFGIPNTTLYRHVLKKYAKFGAGRAAFGAGGQKHIAQSCQLLPQ